MICYQCGKEKLSKEFPHEHLTEDCTEHPLLHCLRCATASVKDHHKCSQCDSKVDENNENYKKYVRTLEFLFPTVDKHADGINTTNQSEHQFADTLTSHIVITTLSGECTTLVYNPNQTILSVKGVVEQELKTPCNKQCLLYNDVELKEKELDKVLTLKDYHVQPNSTIYLLVLLYAIPDEFDKVIFDLFWGYPNSGKDYLDASVLVYSDSQFVELVDYKHVASTSCPGAVRHSGDVMDNQKRLGHHTINVSMKSIPAHINKLVFTLSAWNSPNISKYPNLSLRFFDAKNPNKQLCDDTMSHAAYSQAIIMCCLSKRGGGWQVFSLKNPSAGNAMNYGPLKNKIGNLIAKGYI